MPAYRNVRSTISHIAPPVPESGTPLVLRQYSPPSFPDHGPERLSTTGKVRAQRCACLV
jgi:hypothetical protein